MDMKFNPDLTNQAQEIIFSREKTAFTHSVAYFINTLVNPTITHKHLEIILGSKLSYKHHLNMY